MSQEKDFQPTAERLRQASRRYRIGRSAARFFARLVWTGTPGAVCILTGVFLSKILWPHLHHAVCLFPVWYLGVAIYLCFHPDQWQVSRRRADGLTDLRSGSHGTYMALQEHGDARWEEAIHARPPRLKVRVPYGSLVVFLLLLGGAVTLPLLPDFHRAPSMPQPPATPVERAAELVELMRESRLADETYLEKTERLLADLGRQREDGLDAADWQALDEAREELRRQAGRHWRRMREARQDLEVAARALQEGSPPTPSETQQLADALAKLPRNELDSALKEAAGRTGVSEEQLRDLIKRAGMGEAASLSEEECRALGELAEECRKGEPGDGEKAAALKAVGFSGEELRDMMGSGQPGRGGVTRGPGSAALQHLGDTAGGGEFQAKTFRGNPGELEAQLGFAITPPEEEDETGGGDLSRGAGRDFDSGGGRIIWHARLLPRHNEVLKNYFREREMPRDK